MSLWKCFLSVKVEGKYCKIKVFLEIDDIRVRALHFIQFLSLKRVIRRRTPIPLAEMQGWGFVFRESWVETDVFCDHKNGVVTLSFHIIRKSLITWQRYSLVSAVVAPIPNSDREFGSKRSSSHGLTS